jgi:hypothetical protein
VAVVAVSELVVAHFGWDDEPTRYPVRSPTPVGSAHPQCVI